MSQVANFSREDLSSLRSLPFRDIMFLIARASNYSRKLIDYACDNSTVSQWAKRKKPENRAAQFCMILNCLEV